MILLGTTGWDFNIESLDNRIYPAQYREEKLRYYSKFSTMVELQSTFYEIPEKNVVAQWDEMTPKKFDFIARMSKDVTLSKKQEIDPVYIETYFDALSGLDNKLSLVLFHFNKSFQKSDGNVEYLYNLLDECNKHCSQHFVLELLHNSWFRADDDLLDGLKSRSSSLMNTDKRTVTPALRHDELFYLRLRGDSSLVSVASLGKKTQDRDRDIQFYAKYLNSIKKRYHVIFVTIDNHFSGYAWDDLFFLGEELTRLKAKFKGFKDRIPEGMRKKKIVSEKPPVAKKEKDAEESDEVSRTEDISEKIDKENGKIDTIELAEKPDSTN